MKLRTEWKGTYITRFHSWQFFLLHRARDCHRPSCWLHATLQQWADQIDNSRHLCLRKTSENQYKNWTCILLYNMIAYADAIPQWRILKIWLVERPCREQLQFASARRILLQSKRREEARRYTKLWFRFHEVRTILNSKWKVKKYTEKELPTRYHLSFSVSASCCDLCAEPWLYKILVCRFWRRFLEWDAGLGVSSLPFPFLEHMNGPPQGSLLSHKTMLTKWLNASHCTHWYAQMLLNIFQPHRMYIATSLLRCTNSKANKQPTFCIILQTRWPIPHHFDYTPK